MQESLWRRGLPPGSGPLSTDSNAEKLCHNPLCKTSCLVLLVLSLHLGFVLVDLYSDIFKSHFRGLLRFKSDCFIS